MIIKFIKNKSPIIIVLVIVSISIFIMEPRLRNYYINEAMENNYWMYYSITFFILLFTLLTIWIINKTIEGLNLKNVPVLLIYLLLISFYLQPIIKNIALSINLIKENDTVIKTFTVVTYSKTCELYNTGNDEHITNTALINKINASRIIKSKKSINDLKTYDTINVKFTKGLFGVEYFK